MSKLTTSSTSVTSPAASGAPLSSSSSSSSSSLTSSALGSPLTDKARKKQEQMAKEDEKRREKVRLRERQELEKAVEREKKLAKQLQKEREEERKKMRSRAASTTSDMNEENGIPDDKELQFLFTNLLEELGFDKAQIDDMSKSMARESKWHFIQMHRENVDTMFTGISERLTPRYFIIKLQAEPTVLVVTDLRACLHTQPAEWALSFRELKGMPVLLNLLFHEHEKHRERPRGEFLEFRLECVQCLKMLLATPEGRDEMASTKDSVNHLALCLVDSDSATKKLLFEILSLMTMFHDLGPKLVLESFSNYKYTMRERIRFTLLVDCIRHDPDLSVKVTALTLVNSLISSTQDVDERVEIRNDFLRLGVLSIFEAVRENRETSPELKAQVEAFIADHEEDQAELAELNKAADVNLNDCVAMVHFLNDTLLGNHLHPLLMSILQSLCSLPLHPDTGMRLWVLVSRMLSQIAMQKSAISLDDGSTVHLEDLLTGVDDKLNYDAMKRKYEEVSKRLEQVIADAANSSDASSSLLVAERQKCSNLEQALGSLTRDLESLKHQLASTKEELAQTKLQLTSAQAELGTKVSSNDSSRSPASENAPAPPPPPPPPGKGASAIKLRVSAESSPDSEAVEGHKTTPRRSPTPPPTPKGDASSTDSSAPPPPPPPPPGPGAPPPPPPPGLLGGVKRSRKQKPSVPVKNFHWTKIPNAQVAKTIFSTPSGKPEATFNFAEIEKLFCKAPAKSTKPTTPSSPASKAPKAVSIIDSKRSQNLGVFLRTFAVRDRKGIKNAILACNKDVLTPESTARLIENAPTVQEVESIQAYLSGGGDQSLLGEPELYLLEISSIPCFQERLSCISFTTKVPPIVKEISNNLKTINSAIADMKSPKFLRFLEYVLQLGNFLNEGTPKGNAGGFKLESISKMADTKNQDNSGNLFQYLISYVSRTEADVLQFTADLGSVHQALSVSFTSIQESIKTLRRDSAQASLDVDVCLKSRTLGPEDVFNSTIPPLISGAVAQCVQLQSTFDAAQKEFKDLSLSFGEPDTTTPEEFFKTVHDIISLVETTKKQLEMAERQKEAAEKRALEQRRPGISSGASNRLTPVRTTTPDAKTPPPARTPSPPPAAGPTNTRDAMQEMMEQLSSGNTFRLRTNQRAKHRTLRMAAFTPPPGSIPLQMMMVPPKSRN
ncbi:disheveled-associated activator of morphogenesis 1 [Pelomyxa schiedti]|nr:disheveled-associated activator of morphogenesis 1 [Pelomyxa schiedti]